MPVFYCKEKIDNGTGYSKLLWQRMSVGVSLEAISFFQISAVKLKGKKGYIGWKVNKKIKEWWCSNFWLNLSNRVQMIAFRYLYNDENVWDWEREKECEREREKEGVEMR